MKCMHHAWPGERAGQAISLHQHWRLGSRGIFYCFASIPAKGIWRSFVRPAQRVRKAKFRFSTLVTSRAAMDKIELRFIEPYIGTLRGMSADWHSTIYRRARDGEGWGRDRQARIRAGGFCGVRFLDSHFAGSVPDA